MQLLNGLLVETQIPLATDEDDGQSLAEVQDLGNPLFDCQYVMRPEQMGRRTFSWTLSRESGESMAKQMRMTWESGYERGRRRS